jgi:hypothetical protein
MTLEYEADILTQEKFDEDDESSRDGSEKSEHSCLDIDDEIYFNRENFL